MPFLLLAITCLYGARLFHHLRRPRRLRQNHPASSPRRCAYAAGHNVVTLRQPGGTALGDRIRGILLDSRSEASLGPIAPATEMALMFADRAQAIAEIIEPALAAGSIVLCDRYTDSSEAYQGGGRQLGSERILAMHAAACGNLQPDLTLLLLPSLEASLKRARRRNQRHTQQQGTDENRFERESDDFYRRIYDEVRRDRRARAASRSAPPRRGIHRSDSPPHPRDGHGAPDCKQHRCSLNHCHILKTQLD